MPAKAEDLRLIHTDLYDKVAAILLHCSAATQSLRAAYQLRRLYHLAQEQLNDYLDQPDITIAKRSTQAQTLLEIFRLALMSTPSLERCSITCEQRQDRQHLSIPKDTDVSKTIATHAPSVAIAVSSGLQNTLQSGHKRSRSACTFCKRRKYGRRCSGRDSGGTDRCLNCNILNQECEFVCVSVSE